ncbi:MAG: tRNA-i(6)A37 methylthiotransferase, partial [uncultured Ramlibacter sp.]
SDLADPAPAAAIARAAGAAGPSAGGHPLPGDREVRPPAARTRRRPHRLRQHHGRLQQVLQLLRRALHTRGGSVPAAGRRAGRSGGTGRPGRPRGHLAGPERQCLARAHGRHGGTGRLRAVARVRGRDPGHRAHPLHHQPPQRIHPAAGRGVRQGAEAGQPPAPAGAAWQRPDPDGDEAWLHRDGIQEHRPQAARGQAGTGVVQRLHRRLPGRDRGRLRQADEAGRGRRLRQQLQLHLQPAPGHPCGHAGRRHAARRQAAAAAAPAVGTRRQPEANRGLAGRHGAADPGGRTVAQGSGRADGPHRVQPCREFRRSAAAGRPDGGRHHHAGASAFAARRGGAARTRRRL